MAQFRQRWNSTVSRPVLVRSAVLALFLLMTVQFVGCYLFLSHPYIDFNRYAHGYERLPFQTRLLLAPFFRWALASPFMIRQADEFSRNSYFFPRGIGPGGVAELYLNIPCVLIAGWVAIRLYQSASRRQLLGWLVYPLFLVLCTVTFVLHAVQNYRFIYDMPSLMFFALGLYLIYFRKPTWLLIALFAVATLNRETTLFLIPFYLLSDAAGNWRRFTDQHSRSPHHATSQNSPPRHAPISFLPAAPAIRHLRWSRLFSPEVALASVLMLAYWLAWHAFIFHFFQHNSSEYYSRIQFNLYCLRRLRYYPQLFSACGYLIPFLFLMRRHIHDAQLRLWLWMVPGWVVLMSVWGILVETRVYGELIPFIACAATLVAEEVIVAAVRQKHLSADSDQERMHLMRAA
jgi:hypothetical protein